MCARTRGPVAAGPHATVEVVDSESSGKVELRLTVDVPFELKSMSEAELDVGTSSVKLCGPAPACEQVCASLPEGFVLDPEQAAAKFSKKKRQLTITCPQPPLAPAPASPSASATPCEAKPAEQAARPTPKTEAQPLRPPASSSSVPAAAVTSAAAAEEDDDDDDMPPPLEASRSAPAKPASDLASNLQEAAAAGLNSDGLPEAEHENDAAAALMEKALAAREQKRKETEEARRKADLSKGGAVKKGFLCGSKAKKRAGEEASRRAPKQDAEEIPFITGASDPEAARRESLKLPEVQRLIQQNTQKLKEDNSWVTPQLMQALGSRPDLTKAMSDPKIQEAMTLMQSDPEAAKKRYKDDPAVTAFFKDFSSLMATHFDVLSKEAPNPPKASSAPTEPQKPIPAPITGLDLAAKPPPAVARPPSNGGQAPTGLPIDDPNVMRTLQDPEVQALIAAIKAGQPFELHELGRTNPKLFMKVKVLLDSGLLAMAH